jgi:small multidrug resistance family-3 protein
VGVIDRLVSNPIGALCVLGVAALLEAWGDSLFQQSFYRSTGVGRMVAFAIGTLVLAGYGSLLNFPRWDFGRLVGVYVLLFFLTAQVIAKVRFDQSPTLPICVGGALIAAGGLVMAFWKG